MEKKIFIRDGKLFVFSFFSKVSRYFDEATVALKDSKLINV